MSAYLASSLSVLLGVGLCLTLALALGYAIARLKPGLGSTLLAWLLVIGGVMAVDALCAREPPGFRMLALITYGLIALKAVVVVEARKEGMGALPPLRWLAFAAWFGMRPELFAGARLPNPRQARRLAAKGALRLAAGTLLVCLANAAARQSVILGTALLLIGLSLVLHFGVFNLAAAAWQLAGFDCRSLFRAPLSSTSLSEFWGRRWNLGFNEMTALAVYRPLARRIGRQASVACAFLFSGLLHEMAISLPVRKGFGLPIAYFLLHGGAMLFERSARRRGRPIAGALGRVWTLLWLAVPLPLLFHASFLKGVLWPLIGID